jgi:hypothetical protein
MVIIFLNSTAKVVWINGLFYYQSQKNIMDKFQNISKSSTIDLLSNLPSSEELKPQITLQTMIRGLLAPKDTADIAQYGANHFNDSGKSAIKYLGKKVGVFNDVLIKHDYIIFEKELLLQKAYWKISDVLNGVPEWKGNSIIIEVFIDNKQKETLSLTSVGYDSVEFKLNDKTEVAAITLEDLKLKLTQYKLSTQKPHPGINGEQQYGLSPKKVPQLINHKQIERQQQCITYPPKSNTEKKEPNTEIVLQKRTSIEKPQQDRLSIEKQHKELQQREQMERDRRHLTTLFIGALFES